MSLQTLVTPYTALVQATTEGGRGVLLHDDGIYTLSSDQEWFYASDDVPVDAMNRAAPSEPVVVVRNGADVARYLRTRSGVVQVATAFRALEVAPIGGVSLLTGKLVWVDSVNGVNATGVRGDAGKPFLTIQAAITASVSGDTVVVRPGTYAPFNLLNGVDVYGMPGAIVTGTGIGGNEALVWDNSNQVFCRVMGHFRFVGLGHISCFRLTGAGSEVTVECDSAKAVDADSASHIAWNQGGTLRIRCREVAWSNAACIRGYGGTDTSLEASDVLSFGGVVVDPVTAGGVVAKIRANRVYGKVGLLSGNNQTTLHVEADAVTGDGDGGHALIASSSDNTILVRARDVSQGGGQAVVSGDNGTAKIVIETATLSGGSAVHITGGNPSIHIRAAEIVVAGRVVYVESSTTADVDIEANKIQGDQIVTDIANCSGSVRIRARWIYCIGTDWAFFLSNNHNGMRYDIRAQLCQGSIRMNAQVFAELYVDVDHLEGNAAGLRVFDILTGIAFLKFGEALGSGIGQAPVYCRGGTTHVKSGRLIGLNGDAAGHAIAIADDASVVKVYPGVVLIAGDDAGAKSIGLAGAGATPTAVLMGAIAANKAADADVTVAVGSLLVDAAVA